MKTITEYINESLIIESVRDFKKIAFDTLALSRNNFKIKDELKNTKMLSANDMFALTISDSGAAKYVKLYDIVQKDDNASFATLEHVVELIKKYFGNVKFKGSDGPNYVGELKGWSLADEDTLFLTDDTDGAWYKHKGFKGKYISIF